jgi:hypothetical protein
MPPNLSVFNLPYKQDLLPGPPSGTTTLPQTSSSPSVSIVITSPTPLSSPAPETTAPALATQVSTHLSSYGVCNQIMGYETTCVQDLAYKPQTGYQVFQETWG